MNYGIKVTQKVIIVLIFLGIYQYRMRYSRSIVFGEFPCANCANIGCQFQEAIVLSLLKYCLDFKSVSNSILITCTGVNANLNLKSQVNSLK